MPYASKEFHKFASEWNIKLTTSSPLYPQSNSQSERLVQIVKQMLKKAKEEGKDFIPLSHYSKNVLRTYQDHKMSKFVVMSARNFQFFPNLAA